MKNPRPLRAASAAGIAKRRAFTRPSPARMKLLWDELKGDRWGIITASPANNNLSPNNLAVYREHFARIYQKRGEHGIHRRINEVYLQFVCNFVNRAHGRDLPGQIPVCAVKDAIFFMSYYNRFVQGEDTEEASRELNADGLHPANFLQLRHLFLLDRTYRGHMALIVISPAARTVDYLDSQVSRDDRKMGIVFNFLAEHLGDLFLPHEWRVRQGHSPHQGNTRNCAIYAATNAMFIAFGYPLDYAGVDMLVRRYTMASELMNGANGMFYHQGPGTSIPAGQLPFHYPLTDYWVGKDANARSRGFRSLNQAMLDVLPDEVCRRGGKYR